MATTQSPSSHPVTSMLRTEKRAMTFHLPYLPSNIVQEMVYKRTKPKTKPLIKCLAEKELVNERKNKKRIFTEGISVDSRLNFVDFDLGMNFVSTNVPDHTNYYRSRKGNSIHLTAWRHRHTRHRSRSPPEKTEPKPMYGIYKQGIPGERALTLPKLMMPTNYTRNGTNIRFSEELNTPRNDEVSARDKNGLSKSQPPPNSPNHNNNAARKRLSIGLRAEPTDLRRPISEKSSTDFQDEDAAAVSAVDKENREKLNGDERKNEPVSKDSTLVPLHFKGTSPRNVSVKHIVVGDQVPTCINVEVKQRQQLREMYPMFNHNEKMKETKPRVPLKRSKQNKPQVKYNLPPPHTQPLDTKMHTQLMKIIVPNKDYMDIDEAKARENRKSAEIPSTPFLKDHTDNVKLLARGDLPTPKDNPLGTPKPSATDAEAQKTNEDEKQTENVEVVVDGDTTEPETQGETEVAQGDSTEEKERKLSVNSQVHHPPITRRTSSLLEVPVTNNADMERPPSSSDSVDANIVNGGASGGVETPGITVSREDLTADQ